MNDDIKFAELICTRYSHDLAGPVGSIHNGIEYLELDGQSMQGHAADLIKSSSKLAVTKIQFFRQAFGHLQENSQISLSDLMQTADSYYALTKIKLTWKYNEADESLGELNARFAKLILNILYFASLIVIQEGCVNVTFDSNKRILFDISGHKIIEDDYILSVLKGEMKLVELNSKNIHIYYTRRIIEELNAKLAIEKRERAFLFTVTL